MVPSGDVATQDIDGHVFTLAAGATASGKDFDDFKLLPQPVMSHLSFTVTTPAGKAETVTSLVGNVQQGDTVTARFTLDTAEPITLVSYTAPNNTWDTANLESQRIFSQATTSGGTGTEILTVKVPDGYFQIDFVAGPAINVFDPNSERQVRRSRSAPRRRQGGHPARPRRGHRAGQRRRRERDDRADRCDPGGRLPHGSPR